ncbi:MAG: hypothetical protein Q9214_003775, partial [Letrouitia sp. 1 TL-2023]
PEAERFHTFDRNLLGFHFISIAMRLKWLLIICHFALSECKQEVIQTHFNADEFSLIPISHLDFTSSAPHIFAGVRDLFQQWPNTFSPNGHSLVPCTIRPFTSLYHARVDKFAPSSPEWLAFDAELAYGVMGSSRDSHLMTYQTTRKVQCLYFDGMSAVLAGNGRVDSQMALVFGNVTGPQQPGGPAKGILGDDLMRAQRMCDWILTRKLGGPGWGIEGIVRMAAGFELIWCNFSSPSLRLISYLNVTVLLNAEPLDHRRYKDKAALGNRNAVDEQAHQLDPESKFPLPTLTQSQAPVYDPADPTQAPDVPTISREPFQWSEIWQWFVSATWHYGRSGAGPGRGEDRIKPATCGFLTYYAPTLEDLRSSFAERERSALNLTQDGRWKGSSLSNRDSALQELSRRRRRHTLVELSSADASLMTEAAEVTLRKFVQGDRETAAGQSCSGMDWMLLANTISQKYTDSLNELNHILVNWQATIGKDEMSFRNWFDVARDHVHSQLLPYFEYPTDDEKDSRMKQLNTSSSRGRIAYSRCRLSWTRLLSSDQRIKLNNNERLLKWAVEETVGAVCSVILKIGLGVEREWEHRFNQPVVSKSLEEFDLLETIKNWIRKTEELTAWLAWTGDHITCKKRCRWDEKCNQIFCEDDISEADCYRFYPSLAALRPWRARFAALRSSIKP